MTTVLIENGKTLLIPMKCRCANSVAQFRGMSGFKSTLSSSTNGLLARDTFPIRSPANLSGRESINAYGSLPRDQTRSVRTTRALWGGRHAARACRGSTGTVSSVSA
jgi:hypothetical protein